MRHGSRRSRGEHGANSTQHSCHNHLPRALRLLGRNVRTKGQGCASKAGRAAPKRGLRHQNIARGAAGRLGAIRMAASASQSAGRSLLYSAGRCMHSCRVTTVHPSLLTRALALASWQRLRGQRLLGSRGRGWGQGPHPPTRPVCTEGGHRGILVTKSAPADTQIRPHST